MKTAIASVLVLCLAWCFRQADDPEKGVSSKMDGQQIIRPAKVEIVKDGVLK